MAGTHSFTLEGHNYDVLNKAFSFFFLFSFFVHDFSASQINIQSC